MANKRISAARNHFIQMSNLYCDTDYIFQNNLD